MPKPTTYDAALKAATGRLANISASSRLDATLLLCRASGQGEVWLLAHGHEEMSPEVADLYETLLARRETGEPVAYILGEKEFWGFPFKVGPGVLVPRPDTETLIATLCTLLPEKNATFSVADLGSGSGCIIVSLLKEFPNVEGFAVDESPTALEFTHTNAEKHKVAERLTVLKGDWAAPLPHPVNIIVSNPPYIKTADIPTLMPDVRLFEPHKALDGGPDGLDAYRSLIPSACDKLVEGGLLLLEAGADTAAPLRELLVAPRWQSALTFRDLAGVDRVVAAVKAADE